MAAFFILRGLFHSIINKPFLSFVFNDLFSR